MKAEVLAAIGESGLSRAATGAYTWIGTGEGLRRDRYDFNDAIVPIVLECRVNLVTQVLPLTA